MEEHPPPHLAQRDLPDVEAVDVGGAEPYVGLRRGGGGVEFGQDADSTPASGVTRAYCLAAIQLRLCTSRPVSRDRGRPVAWAASRVCCTASARRSAYTPTSRTDPVSGRSCGSSTQWRASGRISAFSAAGSGPPATTPVSQGSGVRRPL
ncbi:hypothetical protein ABZV80_24560 [Streptomyces sp. NPDC005132]|uniref:hypothetical protein n=1 Tax=Streptomyces sp. NPDC005132 TaxID=3154294 RepID=UPI0033AC2C83